ncbi:MAG: STAS domain-containing protein [Streptosporangiaceae bacterium]|nr:STAS domain-containing protein [Streptosporangiaceae bacterium]
MHLGFSSRILDDHIIVEVHGELDLISAPSLQEDLLGILVQRGNRIVLDLSGLTFMDAAGLRVLLAINRRAGLLGGTLSLADPRGSVARILQLTDLDQYFAVFPSVAKAIVADRRARAHLPSRTGAQALPRRASRNGRFQQGT